MQKKKRHPRVALEWMQRSGRGQGRVCGASLPEPGKLVRQGHHRSHHDEGRALDPQRQFGQLIEGAANDPLAWLGAALDQRHRGVARLAVGQQLLADGGAG